MALAVIAIVLMALGPIGWRAGWFDLRFALLGLMSYSACFGAAAAIVAMLALVFGRSGLGRRGVAAAILALVVGAFAVYMPWHYRAQAQSVPAIHDITTDAGNPPAFVAAIPLRAAEGGNPATYEGARIAALQQRAYPGIAPLMLGLASAKAFALALATAEKMGWTIIAADPEAGRIEASQRSFWYGFTDDIVVRVAASGAGSRIDLRSSARHGRSDLGVNAARIRRYLAALRAAAGAPG